jgi:hypothetical protein
VLLLGGELGNNSVATFKLVKAPLWYLLFFLG